MPDSSHHVDTAEAAYNALRDLAHTVRDTPTSELYALNREFLGIARLFPDVLRKVSALALARSDEASLDSSTPGGSGKGEVERAARRLLAASELIDAAESNLGRASQALSVLVWHPESTDATSRRESATRLTPPRHEREAATATRSSAQAEPLRSLRSSSQSVPGLRR